MSDLDMLTSQEVINASHLNGSEDLVTVPFHEEHSPNALAMALLYTLILFTGVFGNVCTCIVITRNKYMRTATNYYLFSLAISDLSLLILGLPQDVYQLWYPDRQYISGEVFCILRGLSSETSSNASILTITAFTIERYLAICHPLRAHAMSNLSRVIKLIIVIWLCALLGAAPLAYQFNIEPSTYRCTITRPIEYSFEISFLFFFIIPGVLILVLYIFIGVHLRRSEALKRAPQIAEKSANLLDHPVDVHPHSGSMDTLQAYERFADNNGSLMSKYRISLLREASTYSKFKPSHSRDSTTPTTPVSVGSPSRTFNGNSHNNNNNSANSHRSLQYFHHLHSEARSSFRSNGMASAGGAPSACSSSRRAVVRMLGKFSIKKAHRKA